MIRINCLGPSGSVPPARRIPATSEKFPRRRRVITGSRFASRMADPMQRRPPDDPGCWPPPSPHLLCPVSPHPAPTRPPIVCARVPSYRYDHHRPLNAVLLPTVLVSRDRDNGAQSQYSKPFSRPTRGGGIRLTPSLQTPAGRRKNKKSRSGAAAGGCTLDPA